MNIVFDKTKIYECEFIKKDGTPRQMLFTLREDLIPETKGNKRVLPEGLVTVFDLEAEGWRTVNTKTLKWIKEVE